MKLRFAHIFLAFAAGLLASCNIYTHPDDAADCGVAGMEGMSVNFTISAGSPAGYGTRASSYDAPSLENGTEWESHIDISGGDYLFYLFDADGIFREILNVKDVRSAGNGNYVVRADAREDYNDFTIVALANWRTQTWNLVNSGNPYPVLTKGRSTIDEIWTGTAGLRVYDASSRTFTPSETSRIPMYGARTYSLNDSAFNYEEISLGSIYLIRALAKIDVMVAQGSGVTLNSVQLNCFSNSFHCAPVGMTAMDDEWDQTTDDTMNMNLLQESFSPSSLEFTKIENNLYRIYVPEYPNRRADVKKATISVAMSKGTSHMGGLISFEGLQTPSSTEKTTLNILRNNYYKFIITVVTEYETNIVVDVVPFDNVKNDLVFE